ncbi:hypothetical protein ACFWYW_57575 [Nonomuraea sp. NPDC059023]|uniref:hypothetical protein n=1 Tax=unclassified Nonomuraea TaxID=2593643 RepID=UPI0036B1EC0F
MTGRHLLALPAAPFARHHGRHRRHGSYTGWSGLAVIVPAVAESFVRRRSVPLALLPVSDEIVPFRHPYPGSPR